MPSDCRGYDLAHQIMKAVHIPPEDQKRVVSLDLRIAVNEPATITIRRLVTDADGERVVQIVSKLGAVNKQEP